MDVAALHRPAVEEFVRRVADVRPEQWQLPTPCPDWDVRALVNHVVNEERWTRPIVDGRTIEEVGAAFDGDLLGADPSAAAEEAAAEASEAVDQRVPEKPVVHLSFGDVPIEEYVMQLTADHLIHGWDLAAAIGMDRTLDPGVVDAVSSWFTEREELYRGAGIIGDRTEGGGDPQSDLLAAFGRHPDWTA